MAIDLSTAAGLLERRSLSEARALGLSALAEAPRRVDALRLLAAVSEADGRLDEADRYLGDAVEVVPGDAGVVDELIRVSHLRGDLRRLGRALLLRLNITPDVPALWNDLGAALEHLDDPRQAIACYHRAVSIDPAYVQGLQNGAALTYRLGRFKDAWQLACRAVAISADAGQALVIAAHARQRLGDGTAATRDYRRALALEPSHVPAWEGLAAALRQIAANEVTLRHIRRTVALSPASPAALGNLCEALRTTNETVRAIGFGRRALALAPSLAAAVRSLSLALGDLAEDGSATTWASRALQIAPGDGELMINLGIALKAQARFREAQHQLRAGLARRPHDSNGHLALSTALLAAGGIREGFAEYEWRHPEGFYGSLPAPRWDGRPILDGSLLVRGEQGVGDEIMFIQFVRRLEGRVGRIVFECDPRLVSIFGRSFPDIEFVGRTVPPAPRLSAPDIRAQIALLSLPHVLDFDIADLHSRGPFLSPDPIRHASMSRRMDGLGGSLRVGIAWRSQRRTPVSLRVHTDLVEWAPILSVPGVTFVNLQYGDARAELEEARRRFGAHIEAFDDLDLFTDLEGVLALGPHLDLVISTATSAYVLPAAAGIETWHLLSELGYLGFGADRYVVCPVSRGYVRTASEGWKRVIAEAANDLSRLSLDPRAKRHR